MKLILILLPAFYCLSCTSQNPRIKADTMDTLYGCKLTNEQMIKTCPVDAMGDSLVICKQGTMNVLGSNRGPMTWTEYLSSKYSGAEGVITECKTGKALFHNLYIAPLLTYRDKKLLVDKRLQFDIYDPTSRQWKEQIELPAWRTVVYASQGSIQLSPDSLIFRPVLQDHRAFASADSTYKVEMKRTDHYLYMRTANRLFACGLCGDTLSARRLLSLEKDCAEYFAAHPESKQYLDEKIAVYLAYQTYLRNGGKRIYFDLSVFPYFYAQLKKANKNLPAPRTTLKPVAE